MRHALFSLLICTLFVTACKKNDPTPVLPVTPDYQPTKAGSTWIYETTDNSVSPATKTSFAITATAKDSSIIGKTYRVFTNTTGPNDYYYNNGSDYYQFGGIAGIIDSTELLYLKTTVAAGTGWEETKGVRIPGVGAASVKLNYTLVEKLPTMMVEGNNYTDVLHVKITLSNVTVSNIPIALSNQDINFYYAALVGRIKSQIRLDVPLASITVNTETNLRNAVIVP